MTRIRRFVVTLCIALFSLPLFTEPVIDNDYGWSLDLPEGFSVADATEDGMSYLFSHDRLPVSLAMRLYDSGTYENATAAFDGVIAKLPNATSEREAFVWRNTDCALGTFSMQLNNANYVGWATSVELPSNRAHLVLLCYADANAAKECEQFIISILNSLAVDRGSYYEPGIVATYAYSSTDMHDITLTINNKQIKTKIGAEDAEAAEFVVNVEYSVLTFYAGNAQWKEAWQRYYRTIFRDSFGRLKRAAFDIQNALAQDAARLNSADAAQGMAQLLLTWTQNFTYAREKNAADFTNLIAALTGEGCDCDTRSLLLCALLENMGTKTALFVSRDYGHAVFGAEVTSASAQENARMKAGDREFLLGETTAPVNMGLIAQEFSDTSKWLPVELP
ncbi:MAG: hypothetical protein IJR50_00040 [Treponema sp.]|nr:hypothetical protein [Treponema sp.]